MIDVSDILVTLLRPQGRHIVVNGPYARGMQYLDVEARSALLDWGTRHAESCMGAAVVNGKAVVFGVSTRGEFWSLLRTIESIAPYQDSGVRLADVVSVHKGELHHISSDFEGSDVVQPPAHITYYMNADQCETPHLFHYHELPWVR